MSNVCHSVLCIVVRIRIMRFTRYTIRAFYTEIRTLELKITVITIKKSVFIQVYSGLRELYTQLHT